MLAPRGGDDVDHGDVAELSAPTVLPTGQFLDQIVKTAQPLPVLGSRSTPRTVDALTQGPKAQGSVYLIEPYEMANI